MAYVFLVVAIMFEVIATTALKASDGFTRLWPTLVVIVGYSAAFYLVAQIMRVLPVGMTYAIWSGLGIVLVTALAVVVYDQKPDLAGVLGIGLIVAGVTVLSVWSDMSV